ncbi:MAG: transketolase [Candidatus Levybacteria bacterium]|nr:transketolase [Candidatus Levybacteria bacterium]
MAHKDLLQKAALVRKWSLISTTEAGSGHPTSCLSAADIATYIFNTHFTYDLKNPLNPNNDRFILSKGHAAPLFYTLFALSGAFEVEELKTLRKFTSRLEGHPTPEFLYTDAATGSLGQGLSVGAGLAYLAKHENLPFKTYVLLGDGEVAEGQVWEAANFASYYKLHNLIAIVDVNRLGQSQQTMFEHHLEEYARRFKAFGFETLTIDGHNFSDIQKAVDAAVANKTEKPMAIVARTFKGKGVSFLENNENYHGKAVKKEELAKALFELGEIDDSLRFQLKKPKTTVILGSGATPGSLSNEKKIQRDSGSSTRMTINLDYNLGDEIATREVYGKVLGEIANKNTAIYALDGDVKNSTFSQDFKKAYPHRFVECFIAEQNMVGIAVGMARLGKIPFVSTFAAFLTRAADQIRMAGIGHANIKFVGSHAGVSIGEDGASQMGLEDIALFGTIPGSVILHPSDAVSTAKLIPQLVEHTGISYLRTLRSKTKVIYKTDEKFAIGGSKVLRSSKNDVLTVVAAGITVPEALQAYEELQKEGISIRVIDCYSIKPIDVTALQNALKETKLKTIISVEDHYEHGGLGDMVLSALSTSGAKMVKLAVKKFSHSGKMNELLADAGISTKHIVKTVKEYTK